MPKIIGLTGGIGSGKTTIGKYFEELGIPVYNSDDEAGKITNQVSVLDDIRKEFGDEVFDDKILNRKKLSKIVFNNTEKLAVLNAIIHPLVKENFENWLQKHQNYDIVVKESALLFQTKANKLCYKTIGILTPIDIRIDRVIARDNCTRNEVLEKIKNQITDNELIRRSDFIIDCSNIDRAKMQVDDILKIIN